MLFSMPTLLLLLIQLVSAVSVLATPARGEMPSPPFSMDYAADRATRIVIGSLQPDGSLSDTRTIKGSPVKDASYKVTISDSNVELVRKVLAGTPNPKIVLFQGEPMEATSPAPVLYDLIGISANSEVYGVFAAKTRSGVQFKAHESWKLGSFLTLLNQSLVNAERSGRILAEPPSAAKVEKMFTFLRESVRWPEISGQQDDFYFDQGSGYLIEKCLKGFT